MIDSKAAVMMVSAIAGAITFWGVAYAWGQWLRRPRPETRLEPHNPDARLQRIEHAVEAIALEVERLGEAQRYATRLQADRERLPSPGIATPSNPLRAVTPH